VFVSQLPAHAVFEDGFTDFLAVLYWSLLRSIGQSLIRNVHWVVQIRSVDLPDVMIEAERGQLQDVKLPSRERETMRGAFGKLSIQCRSERWVNELVHVILRAAGGDEIGITP